MSKQVEVPKTVAAAVKDRRGYYGPVPQHVLKAAPHAASILES
jgi:hypothetical protein